MNKIDELIKSLINLEKKWTTPDARVLHAIDMEAAKKKMEHTNTGQRGVKAYTSAVHGTAEEQAERGAAGAASSGRTLQGPEKAKAIASFKSRAKGIKFAKNGQWQIE